MSRPPAASQDVASAARQYDQFLDAVAGGRVAPAGGSVLGFAGAGGAALAEMAAAHTRDHHAASRADRSPLNEAIRVLRGQRQVLLSLAIADASVVDRLFGDGSLLNRERTLQRATAIPLSIAEACNGVLSAVAAVASDLAPTVRMDLVSAVTLLASAAQAALETARGNRDALGTGVVAETMATRMDGLEVMIAGALARIESALGVELLLPRRQ